MDLSFAEVICSNASRFDFAFTPMFKAMSFWDSFQPPEDISTNGHLITWLFNYTTYVNLFWFALVCIGLFGFSLIFYLSSSALELSATASPNKIELLVPEQKKNY